MFEVHRQSKRFLLYEEVAVIDEAVVKSKTSQISIQIEDQNHFKAGTCRRLYKNRTWLSEFSKLMGVTHYYVFERDFVELTPVMMSLSPHYHTHGPLPL